MNPEEYKKLKEKEEREYAARKKCYLYSLSCGTLKVQEGVVTESRHDENVGIFKTKNRGVGCSIKPGVAYNAMVWLEERNDELGRNLLIGYEEQAIASLQERINSHLEKIKILKDEKRNQSLTFKFHGSEDEVAKMMEEVKKLVDEIAPEARLKIDSRNKKGEK
jgi:hypothetical protein